MMDYYVPWNRGAPNIQMGKKEVASWVYDHVSLSVKPFPIDRKVVTDGLLKKLPLTRWGNYSMADVESLWSVLEQDEFMKLFLLAGNKHIPEVFGWCGHLYAMEYTPPGEVFRSVKFRHSVSWRNRAKVALSFLEMVDSFKQTPYGAFMLCDVQQSNFGLKIPDYTVQAIDIDLAELPGTLSDFVSQPGCTTDGDCDFFDCVSYCNYEAHKCTSQVKTNNFLNLCRDVFKTKHFISEGLLEEAPWEFAHELDDILTKCSVMPPNSTVKFPDRYYTEQYDRLYSLLYKIVHKQ